MLSNEELLNIKGGGISSTLLNSLARIINSVYTIGQNIGSAIRRVKNKSYCKMS